MCLDQVIVIGNVNSGLSADDKLSRPIIVDKLFELRAGFDVLDDTVHEIICQLHCQWHAHLAELTFVEYMKAKVSFVCIGNLGSKLQLVHTVLLLLQVFLTNFFPF